MNGGIKIGETEVMKILSKEIVISKKDLRELVNCNDSATNRALCKLTKRHELETIDFQMNGFLSRRYYIHPDFIEIVKWKK